MPWAIGLAVLRMLGAIGLAVLSGLGSHYTHPRRWIHLPFRGHWPYRFTSRSNSGSCSRPNNWQLSTYPRRRIPAFIPHGMKASLSELWVGARTFSSTWNTKLNRVEMIKQYKYWSIPSLYTSKSRTIWETLRQLPTSDCKMKQIDMKSKEFTSQVVQGVITVNRLSIATDKVHTTLS